MLVKSSFLPRRVVKRRWVVPLSRFRAAPTTWECAVYNKLFSLSLKEARQQAGPFRSACTAANCT